MFNVVLITPVDDSIFLGATGTLLGWDGQLAVPPTLAGVLGGKAVFDEELELWTQAFSDINQ